MAISAPEFTIFYAWQSDTPANGNRNLIRNALDQACQRLHAEPDIPYVITVTSDTIGVPGLCDIPAAILQKINAADAVVLDLTYIAQTKGTKGKPKRCPNPNVLFELGYAFRAIGPDRLICVMNEKFGPASDILFDIGHRRHPVKYTTAPGQTRAAMTQALADSLFNAIGPTVRLGPRAADVDSEKQFEVESNEIRRTWESERKVNGPNVLFTFRPTRYHGRRWNDAELLERAFHGKLVSDLTGRNPYPYCYRHTNRTAWGLFNSAYGVPIWSLCYSGQYWSAIDITSHHDYQHRHPQPVQMWGQPEPDEVIPKDTWIDLSPSRLNLVNAYRFAAKWATAFNPKEEFTWTAFAEGLSNTKLIAHGSFPTVSTRCVSPYARKTGVATGEEFNVKWKDYCIEFLTELYGMFEMEGGFLTRMDQFNALGRIPDGV